MLVEYPRVLKLPNQRSYFLFGARNTGKSTLIKKTIDADRTFSIDLLKKSMEARLARNPDELYDVVTALPSHITHVFIDEIQKIPELLDVVHRLIADTDKVFILTGSSARKLKQGGANLLAGRAFVYHLFPLTYKELGDDFALQQVLQWGSLPEILAAQNDEEREEFLFAYAHTYLKEEILEEQFIKDLEPFRRFLEVAAQSNGKVVNFSNIARDVGVSSKTIQNYYSILEDTLIGFFLDAYHGSVRKRLGKQPKFYLFDTGVVRSLAFLTNVKLSRQTNAYGNAFEHFVILECIRLADYYRLRYKFSHFRTQDGLEIDLIIERPGQPLLCVEIKSAQEIGEKDIASFIRLSRDFNNAQVVCICDEEFPKRIQHVSVLPWKMALEEYFCSK